MRYCACLAILGGALLSIGADRVESDKDRIQGDWQVVSFERNGEQLKDAVGDVDRFVDGKVLLVEKDDPCETCEFVVALFPDEDPKQIDFKYTGPERDDIEPGKDTMRGIYQWQGEQLVICMGVGGGERPTEFTAPKGTEFSLERLKRIR
ncbi:MAG TPA: TIGR03067 domain-containing protein [Pirellulales bacterium]